MRNLEIGKSGIVVPALGLGTWAIGGGAWWGNNDDAVSVRTIHDALDYGVKWVDTAPVYGVGHSEEVVGEAIHDRRDKVILSTKCALEWREVTPMYHLTNEGKDVYRNLSKASIMQDVEDSLKRLRTDYIDILYTHWQTKDYSIYPIEETMEALMTLKKQGKIRAIGASNVTAEDSAEYSKYGQLDVIQEKYSIAHRRVETELAPTCEKYGVSIQAYSPLEQGLLTGKVTMETTLAEGDTRHRNPNWKPERRAAILATIAKWKDLCEKYECSIGNLCIAFTGEQMGGIHVLCGARKPEQIKDNAAAMALTLEPGDIARMREDIANL